MENKSGKTVAGLLYLLGVISFMGFSLWFIFSGGLDEPVRQILYFLKETKIESQNISWGICDIIIGFVLLDLLVSLVITFLLGLIMRKEPEMYLKKWEKLLDLPLSPFYYRLLGGVAGEEIIFRWFPLAVIFPIWGTNLALWIIIVLSSLVFGIWHITNQKSGGRMIIFTLPQIIGGITYSYLFLAFGFAGAMIIHFIFDAVLFTFLWAGHRISKDIIN